MDQLLYIVSALAIVLGTFWLISRVERALNSPQSPGLHDLAARVGRLETKVEGLPSLWESERKRAENARSAARVALSRARKRDESDDEDEEDPDLFGDDGDGGGRGRMFPMPAPVAAPPVPQPPQADEFRTKVRMIRGY